MANFHSPCLQHLIYLKKNYTYPASFDDAQRVANLSAQRKYTERASLFSNLKHLRDSIAHQLFE